MIIITQGATSRVVLPEAQGFAINPKRMGASRTAMGGNVIRQESVLHASSAEATYANTIPKASAVILSAMRDVSGSVTLHYKNKTYAAVMTPEFGNENRDQTEVVIRFGIVRQHQ